MPSGVGCSTVIYPDAAAIGAAQIIGQQDYLVWSRLRVRQLEQIRALKQADVEMNK